MTSPSPEITTLPALRAATRGTLAALAVAGVAAFAPTATAGPLAFDTAIMITGEASFDDGFSDQDLPGSVASGSAGVKSGGTDLILFSVEGDTGMIADETFSLTDIGDNVGLDAAGMMIDDDFDPFKMGLDASLTVSNSSTETYEIVLGIDYMSSAEADGVDALAFAELFVDSPLPGDEIFFTLASSDTFVGDADSSGPLPTFGAPVMEMGMETLLPPITITLAGVGSVDFHMGLTILGDTFMDPSESTAAAGGFIFVESVTCTTCMTMPPVPAPLPAPGSLLLLALGLAGVGAARRRRQ